MLTAIGFLLGWSFLSLGISAAIFWIVSRVDD